MRCATSCTRRVVHQTQCFSVPLALCAPLNTPGVWLLSKLPQATPVAKQLVAPHRLRRSAWPALSAPIQHVDRPRQLRAISADSGFALCVAVL